MFTKSFLFHSLSELGSRQKIVPLHIHEYADFIYSVSLQEKLDNNVQIHHILPRCIFPEYSDHLENFLKVSYKDHCICHDLLSKILPDHSGLKWASNIMNGYTSSYNDNPTVVASRENRHWWSGMNNPVYSRIKDGSFKTPFSKDETGVSLTRKRMNMGIENPGFKSGDAFYANDKIKDGSYHLCGLNHWVHAALKDGTFKINLPPANKNNNITEKSTLTRSSVYEIYTVWKDNSSLGYININKLFDNKFSLTTLKNMIKHFRNGYIPDRDSFWNYSGGLGDSSLEKD